MVGAGGGRAWRTRVLPAALAAAFALLALGMVAIHQQGRQQALLSAQTRRAALHTKMDELYTLLKHPHQLARAMLGGARAVGGSAAPKSLKQQKRLRASKLRATAAAPTHMLDEAGEDDEENYLHSSFPTTNRKGVGPGLSAGDPVLNKENKYKMAPPACILTGNCVEEGDDSHDDWRNLKQVADTADEDMEDQLDYLFRMTEMSLEACEEGYGEDEEKLEACEKKETRKMCYTFESMSQLCDLTLKQRQNELDNTYYFDKQFELKTCTNDVRVALLEMCAEAEKIPGINVDHWPWQGHSLNLNQRGFSGDWLLGPYGWSGRNHH